MSPISRMRTHHGHFGHEAFERNSVWRAGADVVWCSTEGLTTVLSLDRSVYVALNELAGGIWTQLVNGKTPEQIIQTLVSVYPDASANEIEKDVLTALSSFVRRELLRPAHNLRAVKHISKPRPSPSRKSIPLDRPPSVLMCVGAIVACHVLVRMLGFRRTLELLPSTEHRIPAPESQSWLEQVSRRIRIADAIYPLGSACLERSLAALWFTRRAGLPTELRIGIQQLPFSAHAWVECNGTPFTDTADYLAQYRVLPVLVQNGAN